MKTLIKAILSLFMAFILLDVVLPQKPIDHRGYIRIIYDGDTLNMMFSADTNLFTGNLEFFKFMGGVIVDSLKVGEIWYSSFQAPSGNVDLSGAPNGSMLFEMNDTIGWGAGLTTSSGIINSLGLYITASDSNVIETSADTNKIRHTGTNGVNSLEAKETGGKNILNAAYRDEFMIDDTSRAYVDASGLHAVAEFYVRDTTLIELIQLYSLANPDFDSSWFEIDADTINTYRIDFGDIELTGASNQFVITQNGVNFPFFVEKESGSAYTVVHTGGYIMFTETVTYSSLPTCDASTKGWTAQPIDRDSLYYCDGTEWVCLNCGGLGLSEYPAVGDTGVVAVLNNESAFYINVDQLPYEIDTVETAEMDSIMAFDTMYVHTIDGNQIINSDTTNTDVLILNGSEITNLLGLVRDTTIDISSSNILNGDSLFVKAAPGSGKAIMPIAVGIFFDYNSVTYTGGNNSLIRTWDGVGSDVNVITLYTTLFQLTEDLVLTDWTNSTYISHNTFDYQLINSEFWLIIGSGFASGNSTAKLIFYYIELDFN